MAEFYSARGWEIPPLPWTNLSPNPSPQQLKPPLPVRLRVLQTQKGERHHQFQPPESPCPPSRAQCQTDLPPLAGSDHQHGRPAERADIGPRCTSSRLPSWLASDLSELDLKKDRRLQVAEFYSARGWEIPPLPWTNLSPPFSFARNRELHRKLRDPPKAQRPIIGRDRHAIRIKTTLTANASYKRTSADVEG